jgi:signal transduction histidine kinase/methyl-accepting chemotaxis protein
MIKPIEGFLKSKDLSMFLLGVSLMFSMVLFSKKLSGTQKRIRKVVDDAFLFSSAIVLLALIIGLVGWGIIKEKVKSEIQDQYRSTIEIINLSLPYFIETGQAMIEQKTSFDLNSVPREYQTGYLAAILQTAPFFQQLYLFNAQGQFITGYPVDSLNTATFTADDQARIQYILNGSNSQMYVVAPSEGASTGLVSFLHGIRNSSNQLQGIILARTDLATNPFAKPVIETLKGIKRLKGKGYLLDEYGRVIFSTSNSSVMVKLEVQHSGTSDFSVSTEDNTPVLLMTRQITGLEWMTVLTVPVSEINSEAIQVYYPFLIGIILISIISMGLLNYYKKKTQKPLVTLKKQVDEISNGNLDQPIHISSAALFRDVNQSLEGMRIGLVTRIGELSHLAGIYQNYDPQKDFDELVSYIFHAPQKLPPDSFRIVVLPEHNFRTSISEKLVYKEGGSADLFAYLDDQILEIVHQQSVLVLPSTNRIRQLKFMPGFLQPAALVGIALQKGEDFIGCLWAGYNQSKSFTKNEIRFYQELADEFIKSFTIAQLYHKSEQSKMRLEDFLSTFPDGVLTISEEGKITYSNAKANELLVIQGNSKADLHYSDVLNDPNIIEILNKTDMVGPVTSELNLLHKGNFSIHISPLEKNTASKFCIIRDISPEKKNKAVQSDFLTIVSHDLRSPLTLMRGYSNMLEMVGSLNEQQRSFVQKISASIEQMNQLVLSLLDLERFETDDGVKFEMISPKELLENVANSLQPLAVQKNIELIQESVIDAQPLIQADPILLSQAMYNFIENAIKFSPVGGKVEIRNEKKDNIYRFIVSDHGSGIAPIDLPQIFEKNFRGTQREGNANKGMGFGLVIVKSIASRHHGRVWAESQLGKGSTFILEMPAVSESPKDPNAEAIRD